MKKRLPDVVGQIGSVTLGLGVLGVASFAFLSISGRALGPAAFAPLATLWVLVNAVGPALFYPLEQEVGREVAARRAQGLGGAPVFRRAAVLCAVTVGVAGLVLLAVADPLSDRVFGGQQVLVIALLVGLAGLGAEHLTRGAMAGGERFGRYGGQLAIDGFARLLGALALAIAGVATAGWYGAVLALAPVVAVLLTVRRLGWATRPGPPAETLDLARAVALLTGGSVLSQLVINAPPVTASYLAGPEEAARAGVFVSVLVLARVPLFLFAAIQAAFLPGLAAMAANGERNAFWRRLRLILGAVVALGLVGVVMVWTIGPWLVTLFYGDAFVTSRADLVPLAAAAGFYMVAAVFAQTLVAVRQYTAALLGWATATVAYFLVLLVDVRLETRIGYAFLAAAVVGSLVHAALLLARSPRLFLQQHPAGPTGQP